MSAGKRSVPCVAEVYGFHELHLANSVSGTRASHKR